jgi:hypothetical protein
LCKTIDAGTQTRSADDGPQIEIVSQRWLPGYGDDVIEDMEIPAEHWDGETLASVGQETSHLCLASLNVENVMVSETEDKTGVDVDKNLCRNEKLAVRQTNTGQAEISGNHGDVANQAEKSAENCGVSVYEDLMYWGPNTCECICGESINFGFGSPWQNKTTDMMSVTMATKQRSCRETSKSQVCADSGATNSRTRGSEQAEGEPSPPHRAGIVRPVGLEEVGVRRAHCDLKEVRNEGDLWVAWPDNHGGRQCWPNTQRLPSD